MYMHIAELTLRKNDDSLGRALVQTEMAIGDARAFKRPVMRLIKAKSNIEKALKLKRIEDRIPFVNEAFLNLRDDAPPKIDEMASQRTTSLSALAAKTATSTYDNNYGVITGPLILGSHYFSSNKLPTIKEFDMVVMEGICIAYNCRLLVIPQTTEGGDKGVSFEEALQDLNSDTGEQYESLNSVFNNGDAIVNKELKGYRYYWLVNPKEKNVLSGNLRVKRLGFPF